MGVPRRSAAIEAALVIALLVLGFFVGSFASRQYSLQPLFYQADFGPAVMVAAGRGFVNPAPEPGSPLAEFLAVRRPSIDRADVVQVPTRDLNQFQHGTRYLILAVAYAWMLGGISWAGVAGLAAVLYGLSVVACYAICRVWLPRALAVAGALFIGFSPLHLQQVPHLRDYSKAPFILWAVVLVMLVASRPLSRRMLLLLSAVCGVVVGVGLGFKMDVVIMAPIFLASLFAFRDRRPWTGLLDKGLAAGAFVLAVTIAAAPILFRLSTGGTNGFHVILLGYSDDFDGSLGINRSAYHFLPVYSDEYVFQATLERAARAAGEVVSFPSPEYDAAGRSYWLAILRHFPADTATRILAAADGVLNLPFSQSGGNFLTPPADHGNPLSNLLTRVLLHSARAGAVFEWLPRLTGWGAVFGVVLVAAAGVRSARLGLLAAWLIFALAGYSSLQFAGRHVFHLEIIPVLGVLVTINLLVRRRLPGWRPTLRFAAASVVLAMVTVASLAALRAYQTRHLRRVFQTYIDSPRHPVQPQFTDTGHGTLRMRWDAASGRPSGGQTPFGDYYVAEFDGAPGQTGKVLDIRYTGVAPDYSRIVSLAGDSGINRIFLPAYGEPPDRLLDGLEMTTSVRNRFRGIYRIDHAERLPLLLTLRLRGDWRHEGLYQTFRAEGAGDPDSSVQLLGTGPAVTRVAWLDRVDSSATVPKADAVEVAGSKAARVTANGIEMDSVADTKSSYVLGFKSVNVSAPAVLIVKGRVDAGGVAFGLLKDNRWYRNVSARTPGDFVAIIDIPDSGIYVPIVTNATARDHDRSRFVLSRFGIVAIERAQP